MSEAPTISERYSAATRSSNLSMSAIKVGDVDVLIAAGLVQDTLATKMIRLRAQYDSVRGGGLEVSCARSTPTGTPLPRVLVPSLKGFIQAREAITAWAMAEGSTRSITTEEAYDVGCGVLDLFLDPNCPSCDGRGFTGGYTGPAYRCASCRESGRRTLWHQTDQQEAFARWLQVQLERKIDRALDDVRRRLRK